MTERHRDLRERLGFPEALPVPHRLGRAWTSPPRSRCGVPSTPGRGAPGLRAAFRACGRLPRVTGVRPTATTASRPRELHNSRHHDGPEAQAPKHRQYESTEIVSCHCRRTSLADEGGSSAAKSRTLSGGRHLVHREPSSYGPTARVVIIRNMRKIVKAHPAFLARHSRSTERYGSVR